MSKQLEKSLELVEMSKLNRNFKRKLPNVVGAYLYPRSINAVRGGRGQLFHWTGLISIVFSAALAWLARPGLAWLGVN